MMTSMKINVESVTITHGSESTDTNYASGLGIDSFTVMVEDDDTRGVTITADGRSL